MGSICNARNEKYISMSAHTIQIIRAFLVISPCGNDPLKRAAEETLQEIELGPKRWKLEKKRKDGM